MGKIDIQGPADWRYNANDRRERPTDRRQEHDRRHRIERRCPAADSSSGQPLRRLNRIWALLRTWFGFERRLMDDRRHLALRRYCLDRRNQSFEAGRGSVLTAEEIAFIFKHS